MASKDWVSAEKQDKNSDQIDVPQLRFPEYTENWVQVQIKNVAKVIGGGTPKTDVNEYWNGNIRWFTPSEVGKSKYIEDSEKHITEKGLKNSSAKLLPKNSILLSSRATIGQMSISLYESSTNQGFQSLVSTKNICNEFLYYLLFLYKKEFIKKASGSTFLEISKNEIEKTKIKIPSFNEQEKIADFLSVVDKKIELMEKKYNILNKYKKGVMQKLFNENVCSEVKENNNYSTKWNIATLDEISKINTGKKDLKDKIDNGIYPFFVRSAKIESINSYSYDGEAILIPGDGKIGEVYHYINGKFDYHQRVYKISDFDKKIKGKYVYYYLQKNFFNHALKYTAKATVDSLRLPIIKEMIIKFPHIKEQSKIVYFLENIDNKIDFLEHQLEKIKEFKKYLLQQMFV
ncbi:MAG: restriction endonuclease subunit S [Methanobrevibacter woesei]|uniref:restriction endonuclease subunit S n=1 Tax=Methanobrevibacter woesei TaxID=190976 RepID=UPI0023F0DF88|nr:restriction endonuclease subunit S [Methanobrevibacter woesei]MCI7290752.1 restriction endonuclease subunit S [Methanobrevibacter woesei]